MARRTIKISPKQQKTDKITQTESLNEVLSSIDSIQTKHREITPKTPTSVPTGKIILVVIFFSIMGLGFLSLGNLDNSSSDMTGDSLANRYDFKIQLLDETEVLLSDYVGQPIILDLMATWCAPCKTQISELQTLKSNFPNVKIVSVSIDLDYDDISKLSQYKADNDMSWIVGRDITQTGAQAFSVESVPTLAFINAEGVVKQYYVGVVYYSTLVDWINSG